MIKKCFVLIVSLLLVAQCAEADPVLSLENAPLLYTPGEAFFFDVRLQDAQNLNSFFIELTVEAADGVAGTDFFFSEDLTVQAPSEYVFDIPGATPDGFEATAIAFDTTGFISLSDLIGIGEEVDTASGINEWVARVGVIATADVGPLTIGFDPDFLELTDDFGDPIPGFDGVTFITPPSINAVAVPEPSTGLFAVVSIMAVAAKRRRVVSRVSV